MNRMRGAGRPHPEGDSLGRARTPNSEQQDRRAGVEGWVFAGEMRVSVQLAYKVPVLGPRDRRLLRAPGPRASSVPGLGPGPWPGRHLLGPRWSGVGKAR